MPDDVTDLHHTHRPGAPSAHPEAVEVLVYLRQQCSVFQLPESGSDDDERSVTGERDDSHGASRSKHHATR